jgi:GntR family transcriptional regulator
VKFHITSGLLKPGDELPSTRALSSQLGVNPMTISKAYSYLERDEVVERRPGRPLVVRAMKEEALRDSKREQIRDSLRPAVTMIQQLGVGRDEALEVFRKMLASDPEEKES